MRAGTLPSGAVLTAAVLGLGMIGRHHARLLQSMPGVRFAGAVDPGGDRFRADHDAPSGHAGSAASAAHALTSASADPAALFGQSRRRTGGHDVPHRLRRPWRR